MQGMSRGMSGSHSIWQGTSEGPVGNIWCLLWEKHEGFHLLNQTSAEPCTLSPNELQQENNTKVSVEADIHHVKY